MTHMMTVLTGLATYLLRILTALSVLLNVILGGCLNQTFSARNWERKRKGKTNLVWLIDAILGKDHCVMSWTYWKTRRDW